MNEALPPGLDEIFALAERLAALTGPYLPQLLLDAVAEQFQEPAAAAVQAVWERISAALHATPKAHDAAVKLVAHPGDSDYTRLFISGLADMLRTHPDLLPEVRRLLDQPAAQQIIALSGTTTGAVEQRIGFWGRLLGRGRGAKQSITITNSHVKSIKQQQ